jgi:exosortase H (IPTLxxWG-CTERM-specific)
MGRILRLWNNPAYRFVLLFALLLAAEAVVYPIVTAQFFGPIQALTRGTALIAYGLMRVFGAEASLDGNLVQLGGFSVRIIEECTGIFEMIIFVAAVVAFPASWPRRAVGLALGLPLLYLFNLVRIIVLLVVGRYAPASFEFMHVYFWQGTLILMITSVWLLWIFKVVRRGEAEPAAGA